MLVKNHYQAGLLVQVWFHSFFTRSAAFSQTGHRRIKRVDPMPPDAYNSLGGAQFAMRISSERHG
jgi:hypothetical protein